MIHLRPHCSATYAVVPKPQVGSSTKSSESANSRCGENELASSETKFGATLLLIHHLVLQEMMWVPRYRHRLKGRNGGTSNVPDWIPTAR